MLKQFWEVKHLWGMPPKNSGGSAKFPGGRKVINRTAQTAFVRVVTPRSFHFLKRRNSLNFRSFCVLEYWRNDSFPKKDFAKIVLTSLRQIM